MVQGTGWHLIFRPNYLHMQTTHIWDHQIK
jgi:hypothetical protein